MGKKNRQKRQKRRIIKNPISESESTVSNNDLIIVKRIKMVDIVITCSAIIPVLIGLLIGPDRIVPKVGWLMLVPLTAPWIGYFISKNLGYEGHHLLSANPYSSNPAEARKKGVLHLSISFFVNISAWIPLLYYWGFIDKLAELLPTKEKVSENASLAIAFSLGAVISGVLGNAAYDLLKLIIKKMTKQENNKE